MSKITPNRGKVAILPDDPLEQSKGGILLPDTAKEKPKKGHIVAVGGHRITDMGYVISCDYKEGDHVLFSHYSGIAVEDDGETLQIMDAAEVLAKISP